MKKIICLFLMFSFFVTGCYFNNAKFHELEQELTNFLNDVNESNYLTFTLSVKVDDEIAEDTIRMMADPIYIETYAEDNGKYTSVITQENDKIFEYKVRENNNVQRYFLGYLEDGSITETQESIDIVELTSFNKNKCKIKIENNTYTITGLYKNLIDKESKDLFEKSFKGAELLLEELFNTTVTIKYVFEEERLLMSTSLTFEYEDISIYMEIIYDFCISPFEPINIYDGSYTISRPRCFEEAYELDNLDEEIDCTNSSKVYYIIELEKGMLVANNRDASFYGFKLHLTINECGEILNFYLTPGNVDDRNREVICV